MASGHSDPFIDLERSLDAYLIPVAEVRCSESQGEECFALDCLCWLILFNAKCWKYCLSTPASDGFCRRNVGFVKVVRGKKPSSCVNEQHF